MDKKGKQLEYDAFISYRHCELDQFVAINLHKKLEKFKLPKNAYMLVEGEKHRIERVFRDEDELPLSDNLSDPIDNALAHTEFLIVICTPRLPESRWCLKEIETFIEMHDRKHVLLVLAEGEPDESFPKILRYEDVENVDENGNVSVVRKELEPLAADTRGTSKKEILKAMDTAVIKLAAAMFGLNYDDLKQRHRQQKIKKLTAIWGSITAAILIFAIVCFVMLTRISIQNKIITDKYAIAMAGAAEDFLGMGKRDAALYTVRSVLRKGESYNPEAYRMLTYAISPYAVGDSYIPENAYSSKSSIRDFEVSSDGKYLGILGVNSDYYIYDMENQDEIMSFVEFTDYSELPVFAFDADDGFYYCANDKVTYIDLSEKLSEKEEKVLQKQPGNVLVSNSSDTVVVFSGNSLIGYKSGKEQYEINLEEYGINLEEYTERNYGFSEDGEYLSIIAKEFGNSGWIIMLETSTGTLDIATNIYIKGTCDITTNGDAIYVINNDDENGINELYIFDGYTSDMLGCIELDTNFAKSIDIINGQLVIRSNEKAVILDAYTVKEVARTENAGFLINTIDNDGTAMVIDNKGHIYVINDVYSYGMDITNNVFGVVPTEVLVKAAYCDNKYFYLFSNANYVSVYEQNELAVTKTTDTKKMKYEDEFSESKDAESVAEKIDDIEKQYIYKAIYSSDETKIAVFMWDCSVRIYDADSLKLLKVLYDIGNYTISSFVYIEEENVYILCANPYSYVLDGNLNYISRLGICVGYRDGAFIVNESEEYYEVPYITYNDMLEICDSILGDYQMNAADAEKYGILK